MESREYLQLRQEEAKWVKVAVAKPAAASSARAAAAPKLKSFEAKFVRSSRDADGGFEKTEESVGAEVAGTANPEIHISL